MVRLSDILKKKIETQAALKSTEETAKPKEELRPEEEKKQGVSISGVIQQKNLEEQEPKEMQITKAMKEIQPDIEYFRRLYSNGIQLIKELSENIKAGEKSPAELIPLKNMVHETVNRLVLGDKSFIAIFCEDYPESEYLYHHMMNVMIMSISLALELNYNKSTLNELGLAAFLHDIGLVQSGYGAKPGVLSKEEYDDIKNHPINGAEIIDSFEDDITKDSISAIKEHHERFNGNGYTRGLKDGEICEFAKVIGIVDVYEALTHTRAYRKNKKYQPNEAIREMLIQNAGEFDPRILKIFVNQIGIYPVGSWVELNSDEIAKVITSNADFPIRPVVNVMFDSARKTLGEARLVDLTKQFNIYIKKPLSDEEVLNLIK